MIRLTSDTSLNEWAKRFIEQLLDDAYLPSLQALRQEKWAALPVADSMGVMEAEWLAEAVRAMGITEAVGVAFEFNSDPEVEILQVGRDALLKYNHTNGHANVCVTSRSLDFLYFKEQNNRFFLLCGSEAFIENAYRCSFDTARAVFLEYWTNDDANSAEEQRYLVQIWTKYTESKD